MNIRKLGLSIVLDIFVVGAAMSLPGRGSAFDQISERKASSCDVIKLDKIFNDPLAFNGRRICTHGYVSSSGRFVAFYPQPDVNTGEMLDIALIPQDETPTQWRLLLQYPRGTRFVLRGRLDVNAGCILQDTDKRQVGYVCSPVRRPLYLSEFEGIPEQEP